MRIVSSTCLAVALIVLTSCARRQPVAAKPTAPAPTASLPAPPPAAPRPAPQPTAPQPTAPPARAASAVALEDATREFARGDYGPAARDYQQYLNLVPSGGQRDQAFFHLGLIYSIPGDSRLDWQRARTYFTQVVTEFPSSPFKPAAQLIITLKNETVQLAAESETRNQRIKQLTAELERLIKIDSERRPK